MLLTELRLLSYCTIKVVQSKVLSGFLQMFFFLEYRGVLGFNAMAIKVMQNKTCMYVHVYFHIRC